MQQQQKDVESEEVPGDMDAESSRKRKDLSRDGSFNAAEVRGTMLGLRDSSLFQIILKRWLCLLFLVTILLHSCSCLSVDWAVPGTCQAAVFLFKLI